jgi:PAS domain-containing protein
MREIEQSVDDLLRTVSEMSRGLSLQTQAEWMGGFGTHVLNLETGELWISEGSYRIAGLRRLSAVSAKSEAELWAEVVHPDDLEAVQTTWAMAIEDGAGHDLVLRIIRPDGDVRQIRGTAQRIDAADGHPAVLLIAVVDVTPPA